jgi:hypothetical protein
MMCHSQKTDRFDRRLSCLSVDPLKPPVHTRLHVHIHTRRKLQIQLEVTITSTTVQVVQITREFVALTT